MAAHPAVEPSGHADDERVIRHVGSDNGAGGDEGIASECYPADDGGVGADGGTTPDHGGFIKIPALHLAAWVGHVGEDAARTEKDIVFNDDAGVNRHVILNFDVRSNRNIAGNHGILTKDATFPNPGARADVSKVPDVCAITDVATIVDHGRRVSGIRHQRETADAIKPAPATGKPVHTLRLDSGAHPANEASAAGVGIEEARAASRVRITSRPVEPLDIGSRRVRRQSTKCSSSARRGEPSAAP